VLIDWRRFVQLEQMSYFLAKCPVFHFSSNLATPPFDAAGGRIVGLVQVRRPFAMFAAVNS